MILATPRPTPPPGQPAEISDLPVAYETLPATVDAAVVFREPDDTTALTVEFPSRETLDGLWAFSAAGVRSDGFAAVTRSRDP